MQICDYRKLKQFTIRVFQEIGCSVEDAELAAEEPPFVADLATTTAAYGKLEILQRTNNKAPFGWLQDPDGSPSQDPHAISRGRGTTTARKRPGAWVPPYVTFLDNKEELVGEGIGHFFGALRVDAFRPADEFKAHMDKWIRRFRSAQPVAGQESVLIPGDPERVSENRRRTDGIPLLDSVVKDLRIIAEKFCLDSCVLQK
ncbi:MAG: hypothetical protein HKP52_00155 [Desulfofustis sp.]|nr:hypothetical protein [Desulfofustis sp.]